MSLRHALLLVIALGAVAARVPAADLFVDSGLGADANDGVSWASAKASVTAALDVAIATPEADVITVAGGTYRERIVVPPDVTLIGSVPSGGGAQDLDAHPSILDGEFGGRVVQFNRGTDGSVLDGFVVTHGEWSDPVRLTGGAGINIDTAGPLITRCRIEGNRGYGGAGVVASVSNVVGVMPPRIEGCVVRNNHTTGPRTSAALIVVYTVGAPPDPLPPLVKNTIVEDNTGGDGLSAGGLYLHLTNVPTLVENVIVRRNVGDGMYLIAPAGATLVNCEVSGNGWWGLWMSFGGAAPWSQRYPYRFEGCTFRSATGPAIDGRTPFPEASATMEIRRCIIDGPGRTLDTLDPGEGPGTVGFTTGGAFITAILNNLIRDCPASLLPTNIDVDPEFATGPLGESYLAQLAAGQLSTSPAVDNGDVTASSVGMDALFTRTDAVTDAGPCDLGVHYGFMPAYAPYVEWLRILRSDRPGALSLVTEVLDLPWLDAPGTLSDPSLPLLYYRVDYPLTPIQVSKDLATDSVRLSF